MVSKLSVKDFTLLATLYHAHHQHYQEDIPYWNALAKQFGGPVLELGCGSGRVLLALAAAGYRVHGLDNDPQMLSVIKASLDDRLAKAVTIWEADMTTFHSDETYPLIIMPCNTYSALAHHERVAVLARVGQHLSPGGVFAVSVPNPTVLKNMAPVGESEVEEYFDHPETGHPVQVSSSWHKGEQIVEIFWHYDHMLPDGQVERKTNSTSHHLLSVEQYQKEFVQAGFDIAASYGDFDSSPYNSESKYYIFQITPRS